MRPRPPTVCCSLTTSAGRRWQLPPAGDGLRPCGPRASSSARSDRKESLDLSVVRNAGCAGGRRLRQQSGKTENGGCQRPPSCNRRGPVGYCPPPDHVNRSQHRRAGWRIGTKGGANARGNVPSRTTVDTASGIYHARCERSGEVPPRRPRSGVRAQWRAARGAVVQHREHSVMHPNWAAY